MLIPIIFISLCLIGIAVCFCLMWISNRQIKRIQEVYEFRQMIIELCGLYDLRHIRDKDFNETSPYEWFLDKWTYDDLLYSKKPLTLEEWYTEEEIKKIKS